VKFFVLPTLSYIMRLLFVLFQVKNLIETCIYKYMSLEETETYVEDNHKISHHLTKPSLYFIISALM